MSSMDRMLLDLNLPPPPHWSPQPLHVISPSVGSRPPSPFPDNVSRKDDIDLLEPKLGAGDSGSPRCVVESSKENGSRPDVEASTTVTRDPTPAIEAPEVVSTAHDSNAGANSNPRSTSPSATEKHPVQLPENEVKIEVNGKGSDPSLVPSVHVVSDVEGQVDRPSSRSVLEDSDDTNTSVADEASGDRGGGGAKVHKRLRTLGQLRSRKVEKNAAAGGPEYPQKIDTLEDEIGGEQTSAHGQEEALASIVSSRPFSQFRNRKGDKSVTTSNGDSTSRRNTFSGQILSDGGSSPDRTEDQEPFLPFGRFAKIPSQPRSKKTEKRANLVPPIVVSEVRHEGAVVGKVEPSERKQFDGGSASSSGKASIEDKPMIDAVEEGEVGVQGAKPEEPKEPSRTSSDAASQSAGGKRPGMGLKDAMPGKKRRQTVLLEVGESLKQARPLKTPTSDAVGGRIVRTRREVSRPSSSQVPEKQDSQSNQGATSSGQMEASMSQKAENVNDESAILDRNSNSQPGEGIGQFRRPVLKRQISTMSDTPGKGVSSFIRVDSAKGLNSAETRIFSNSFEGSELQKPRRVPRKNDVKKPTGEPKDASIERLHREATCFKLWQTSGTSDLQKVPGRFESVEDYVRVLEPLLFEECRAQLNSSWEELLEGSVKDAHVPVTIKGVERRERGWYDLVVLPENPHTKFKFKEGDVAVISTPKPGSAGKPKGRIKGGPFKEKDGAVTGRITGIVRRYYPIDVRDPPGATLHFHVSQDEFDAASIADTTTVNGNVMKDLEREGLTWYLTVLGGVTTTQREYIALHFLQQFHPKMLNAILQPRPELFPGYADQEPPAMPECFTPAFVQHLHEHFNGPQLAAIQWAGAHTAAGSGSTLGAAGVPKQEPWPFTLVQGPPGTGKTHTVWGMLNVIHLVQYQRYYQALLKKLAPNSLASEEPPTNNQASYENGSIDDVLQRMDDSLARMLPKLCPKPRMLVCAPSNAATDELLSRVLDRGFIDGEMKVYRPDVARVGSDPSSRAAQAVSVERRSEQLLGMGRDQVVGWLQQLKGKEMNCSQVITSLQRDLNEVATTRSQGNFGVDPEKLAAQDQVRDTKLQQLAALVEERDKILVEMSRLFIVEGRYRAGSQYSHDDARQKLEASFANEAEIVFTTVSSSGRRIFQKLAHGFDMVVIDEAAQASEVAVMPPLSLRAARCVLVGDPQQLPATVISRVADTMQYSRSLFERFQQAGCPAILLSVQYRMHPQIRDFPSRYFYQGRLVDSESVKEKPGEIYHKDQLLQPYLFYDISQGRESHGGSVSYQNKLEAQVAVRLYMHLQKVIATAGIANVSVGMITPYKQQLRCLQSEFEALVGCKADSKGVYINTVDAFQGQERDVIVMSCVRASTHGVGFVADIRRMNVALTRARRSLWVIGNATALVQSEDWAALLADAKSRGSIVDTSTCIAQGLLPDSPAGVTVLSQGGQGLLRHSRPGILPSGRIETASANGSSLVAQGSFTSAGLERGRQQDDGSMHGDSERWPVSGHRGTRLPREGPRLGFSQRNLPPGRSFGARGASLSFRRGRG
ncbi:unnamed protein product [Calypogeia fissa]